jgi:hypothetical protein
MDMSLIQGTISGLKLAGDIAKSFLQLKSIADVRGKVIELQSAILSAQSSALAANAHQTAMVEAIRNLKEKIAHMKAWEEEKKRYKLVTLFGRASAYGIKKSCSGSEPPHWICTKCYEDGRKSILNPNFDKNAGGEKLVCPVCDCTISTGFRHAPPPTYAPE